MLCESFVSSFALFQRLECTCVLPLPERRANHPQVASLYQGKLGITNITSAVAAAVLTITALEALNKQRRLWKTCQRHEAPAEYGKAKTNSVLTMLLALLVISLRQPAPLSLLRSKVLQLVYESPP